MAIKAGTFLHDAQGFVIDRIQTGGVSSLNIPKTTIYELGNYQTVGTVFDIPDASFDIDSIDVSTEVEAIIHGKDPTTITNGTAFDFSTVYPIDIISPFKAGNGQYNIVQGISVPYLTLDTVNYKFGVKANAAEKFTLKTDAVYYIPGSPYYQSFATVAGANHAYTLAHTAVPYTESGNTLYALSACVKNVSTGAYQRLFFGTDSLGFSNTPTTITTVSDWNALGYTTLHVTYGSATAANYPQTVHQGVSVKPSAIRSKDILLYVGSGGTATSTLKLWHGVQSFDVTRKVNLVGTEEFGNTHYVSTDYDVATVSGSINVKSADVGSLWTLIQQVAGSDSTHVSGAVNQPPLEIMLQVRDPSSGVILKTWNIPDARFTVPALQGKANTNIDVTFPFDSDTGLMTVYKGSIS